jgi:hypothetical protein
VGLREAEQQTGIPASTIRNWARKQRIDSRFELDESDHRRYVELSEVIAWADHLGRQHKSVASRESRVASEGVASERVASRESRVASEEVASEEVADRESRVASEEVPSREAQVASEEVPSREAQVASEETADTRDPRPATRDPEPQQAAPDIPEGTMLVPLDAWNKMLNQLGNLHEAGQQLAEARERAAKAETEVQFLRERLAGIREQPGPEPHPSPTVPDPAQAEAPAPDPSLDPLWVDLYRRWKRRRR